ncbi:hypothetical protein [Nonomuraea endophytica]|uniref:PASTA domain-containing protein n=1 Tax=Nonomuraea endophytica TaxID=714136 RepID=A0A7W8A162_9ACTN|nr:hypothetical protein [Nonomuraea endophytica]MBB5076940.1 hypothetical protein [Nonomuraea endophytica]
MKLTKALAVAGLTAVTLGGGMVAAHAATPSPAPAPVNTPAPAPAAEKGVRLPLDYTESRLLRLREEYNRCLKAQGVKFTKAPAVLGPGSVGVPAKGQEAKVKRCADKRVLMPKAMDPRYNRNYDADFREWVRLLNAAGLKVKAVKGGWDYTETPKLGKAERLEIERRTRVEAFS